MADDIVRVTVAGQLSQHKFERRDLLLGVRLPPSIDLDAIVVDKRARVGEGADDSLPRAFKRESDNPSLFTKPDCSRPNLRV